MSPAQHNEPQVEAYSPEPGGKCPMDFDNLADLG